MMAGALLAAAASVASPVAHPTNVLVMGPGAYRFSDFLKLGLPLTLVIFVVAAGRSASVIIGWAHGRSYLTENASKLNRTAISGKYMKIKDD